MEVLLAGIALCIAIVALVWQVVDSTRISDRINDLRRDMDRSDAALSTRISEGTGERIYCARKEVFSLFAPWKAPHSVGVAEAVNKILAHLNLQLRHVEGESKVVIEPSECITIRLGDAYLKSAPKKKTAKK